LNDSKVVDFVINEAITTRENMMNTSGDNGDPSHSGGKANTAPGAKQIPMLANRIASRDLFADTREITIAHGEELYRLRLTAQNKLILTK
jgi:hemin uptake protein HemP